MDENGEVVKVDTRKDITRTISLHLRCREQYKKETEVKEMDGFVEIAMLTGGEEGKPISSHVGCPPPSIPAA